MSTNKSTKNPQLILEEISKRLNRVSGGSRLFSLHEAIRFAKEDTSKLFESLNLIKKNLVKFGQPTAAAQQNVDDILAIIDTFAGGLSIEEIETFGGSIEDFTEKSENVEISEETSKGGILNEDLQLHVVTQELLDEYPELASIATIGEAITFAYYPETIKFVVNQSFLNMHPDVAEQGVIIGDVIEFDKTSHEDDDLLDEFSEEDQSKSVEETSDNVDTEIDEEKTTPVESLSEALDSLAGNVTQPAQTIGDKMEPAIEEKLEVSASKTFEGKKTKVTKKLLSTYINTLGDQVSVGDFVYIDGDKLTAFVPANGPVVILDAPVVLQ